MSDPINTDGASSPPWEPRTRLTAGTLLLLLLVVGAYMLRNLIVPILLSFVISYILFPAAAWLTEKTRISRGITALVVLLAFLLVIVGLSTGLGFALSDRVVSLATYLADIAQRLPEQLEYLLNLQFTLGPYTINLGESNLTPLIRDLASSLSPLLAEAGSLIGSFAKAAASAVSTFVLILVISYYLIIDFDKLGPAVMRVAPPAYKEDFQFLLQEVDRIWRAFLRGQLILGVVIGVTVGVLMIVVGLDFPLVMGFIAGLMEMVPMVGPFISALIAALLALFQPANSWGLTPLAFSAVIVVIFIVLQQIENTVLVPRVIGGSLNLPPLLVFLAVLAGGIVGGIVGILLAAPMLATLRLILGYIYYKVADIELRPGPAFEPRPPAFYLLRARRLLAKYWLRLRSRKRTGDNNDA